MTTTAGERVLIVEDEPATRVGLTELVRTWGFTAASAGDGQEALERITEFRPAIIISDLVMPRMGGLDLLRALASDGGEYTIVILTAQGTVETAVEAIKEGAYDYLTKPIEPQRLKILLDKIVERHDTLREVKVLRKQLREQGAFGQMVGSSAQMRKVYQTIEQAAPTSASVLIWGESGTGKELVAQTVHQLSPRNQLPFVPINCAAIPETLLESEIFGHEKGAFTGAFDRREGCFELADRGTLFLDEIAEMTPATQVKLLRVLQERRFRRLGGRNEQAVDVRVIAATNAVPADAVKSGKLREDLFYRLNVFAIELPPLRKRKEDLPLLIQSFLGEFNARNRKAVSALDPAAMRALEQYNWPGNVRELRNVIERAVILCSGQFIESKHLPPLVAAPTVETTKPTLSLTPGTTVEEAENRLILMTLEHTRDNKTRAAEILGISLKTLHNKLNKLRGRGSKSDHEEVVSNH
ncbi:MAG TPA: sigma-54 dependent transcriptional regulator [Vicinamibacterales bacterium]|jgi:DNA-binding NtrC family response regulator|nr:sigma-54 dependent transcriptional regulator [Vicinamibacterales bacterium]